MHCLSILGFIFLNIFFAYFNSTSLIRIGINWLYLLLCYYLALMTMFWLLMFITILAVISLLKFIPVIKIPLIKKIYYFFKAKLPPISETEAVALNAGESWFEKEIYNGNPDFKKLHQIKPHILSDTEKKFLVNETNQLCELIDDWQIDQECDLPKPVWDFIKKNKFFGLVIPQEYGGKGFSAAAHSDIVLKLATRSISAAVTVMVPNSLGPGELLLHYGTVEQKEYYLPRLAAGIEIPCFALTSPYAGSDAVAMSDSGVVCYDNYQGEETLGIRLKNINKRYITLAPVATLIGLAFKLEDPDNLLQGVGKTGITCVLLNRSLQGLEIGNRLLPMRQFFMNGTVRIKDAFIPVSAIIGGQEMAGQGWRMLVECLSIGRSISLPACGAANSLFNAVTASAYSLVREQFKLAIGKFEGVEEQLASIIGVAYAANATRKLTVAAVDAGIKPAVASAIAKYHLTEMGRDSINRSMDIHAGKAIIMGPNNYIAKSYMGIPIGITVEGSNILTRSLLVFGQGMMHCHPYLRKLYDTLSNYSGLANIKKFNYLLNKIISSFISKQIRVLFHSFTVGKYAKGYRESKFHRYYQQITKLSTDFAYISDLLLFTLGGELKRKERLSARLGDIMSYLYIASATLKQFKDQNEPIDDEIYVCWVLDNYLYKAQESLLAICNNSNNKIIACLLKKMIFPYGRNFTLPSDQLEHKMVKAFMKNTITRDNFKYYCYIPDNKQGGVGSLEAAYKAILANADIKSKVQLAMKNKIIPTTPVLTIDVIKLAVANNIITESEGLTLKEMLLLIDQVIQVDEFSGEKVRTHNGKS